MSAPTPPASPEPPHIVVLLHGIRTQAPWAEMVAALLRAHCQVEAVVPLRYGYFDLLRFLSPVYTRRKPVERIVRELRDIRTQYPQGQISVIAHSFGTYAICQALAEPDIRLARLLLCGSIVRSDFRWDRHTAQLPETVLNDCGTHDILPVLATTATWGYGPSGTFGFGTFRVRNRFSKFTHSAYFTPQFVQEYWVPYIRAGCIRGTDWERQRSTPPWWQSVLTILPLRWVLLLLFLVLPVGLVALAQHTVRVTPALAEGDHFLATGQYQLAKTAYQRALAQSWWPQARARLGLAKASVYDPVNGEFNRQAVQQRLTRLLAHSPDDPQALLFQGDLHAVVGEYEQARALYARAIVGDPKLAHGHYSLGIAYDKMGRTEKALEAYEQAVALAPEQPLYLNNLAHQYVQRQDFGKAIATYHKVLALDGDMVLPYFDLAHCYRVLGQLEEALSSEQKGVFRLDQPHIAGQEKNQQPWYFRVGNLSLHLDTLPRKQCYASRSLAATLRALHRLDEAERYQRRPCAVDADDERGIQEWVAAAMRVSRVLR